MTIQKPGLGFILGPAFLFLILGTAKLNPVFGCPHFLHCLCLGFAETIEIHDFAHFIPYRLAPFPR